MRLCPTIDHRILERNSVAYITCCIRKTTVPEVKLYYSPVLLQHRRQTSVVCKSASWRPVAAWLISSSRSRCTLCLTSNHGEDSRILNPWCSARNTLKHPKLICFVTSFKYYAKLVPKLVTEAKLVTKQTMFVLPTFKTIVLGNNTRLSSVGPSVLPADQIQSSLNFEFWMQ